MSQVFSYTNPTIAELHDYELGLACRINAGRFFYTVFDLKNGSLLSINSVFEDKYSSELFSSHPLLKINYGKHVFCLPTLYSTLIPAALYADGMETNILKTVGFYDKDKHHILVEHLPIIEAKIVSYIDKSLLDTLNCKTNPIILSDYLVLLKSFINRGDKRYKHNVFANIENDTFDLFVFEKKELIFANSYKFSNTKKFFYYLLYALNLLKIDLGNMSMVCCGEGATELLVNEISMHILGVTTITEAAVPITFDISIPDNFIIINAGSCAL